MRKTCTKCARKHIAQAVILLNESKLGYPEHLWLAVGHLAEAEAELDNKYHELAEKVRIERLKVMNEGDSEGLMDLIKTITLITEQDKANCCSW